MTSSPISVELVLWTASGHGRAGDLPRASIPRRHGGAARAMPVHGEHGDECGHGSSAKPAAGMKPATSPRVLPARLGGG